MMAVFVESDGRSATCAFGITGVCRMNSRMGWRFGRARRSYALRTQVKLRFRVNT